MNKVLSLFGASLLVLTVFTSALQAAPEKPKVHGILFFSESCGSCKILDPKIEKVKASFKGQPVLFTKLDHSNDFSSGQAELLAASIGVGNIYSKQAKKSGYMLLVNDKNEVVAKLTKKMTEDEISAEITNALK